MLKFIFPYVISWWQLLQRDLLMSDSTIMLGLNVEIWPMREGEWFVKWLGLSIIWMYPAVDVMLSGFFPVLSTVSKEHHFEHFPLNFPAIIEIGGLRLLMMVIRIPKETQKDWDCSRFWLGDLYKHVRKHRSFLLWFP